MDNLKELKDFYSQHIFPKIVEGGIIIITFKDILCTNVLPRVGEGGGGG